MVLLRLPQALFPVRRARPHPRPLRFPLPSEHSPARLFCSTNTHPVSSPPPPAVYTQLPANQGLPPPLVRTVTNKHARKTRRAWRGTVGKRQVVGARDRASGQLDARPVPNTTKGELRGGVRGTASPGAAVHTDTSSSHQSLRGFRHAAVNHSAGEFVRGKVNTNGIVTFWATFKRGLYGTYHHMSRRHLHRYLAEFCGRSSVRKRDRNDQLAWLALGLTGKRLTWQMLRGGDGTVAAA